jgi:hypothetical protein
MEQLMHTLPFEPQNALNGKKLIAMGVRNATKKPQKLVKSSKD